MWTHLFVAQHTSDILQLHTAFGEKAVVDSEGRLSNYPRVASLP